MCCLSGELKFLTTVMFHDDLNSTSISQANQLVGSTIGTTSVPNSLEVTCRQINFGYQNVRPRVVRGVVDKGISKCSPTQL